MTNSKNNSGFTLVEVMLAVFIAALVLVPVFSNQTAIFQSIWRSSRAIVYILQAKKLLVDQNLIADSGQPISNMSKKIDFPKTILTFEQKKIPENSALKKFSSSMLQQVRWTDETDRKRRKDGLVTFRYMPEPAP